MATIVRRDRQPARPAGKSLRPLGGFLPLLLRYRRHVALALVALVVAAGATLSVPVAVRRVIDHGFSGGDATLINQYFAVMLAVVARARGRLRRPLLSRHLARRAHRRRYARSPCSRISST